MRPRLLLINPNTSTWVTDALVAQVERSLGAQRAFTLTSATATLGASYIASEASFAIAAHGLLDAYASQPDAPDAVAIGCFGDPGLHALQALSGLPVIGMAGAAMHEAALGGPFAIVTGGSAWPPMLRRLAADLGLAERLVTVIAVAPSAAELATDRHAALQRLALACQEAAETGASRIILGGAAFAGYGDELAGRTGMPIIDSVSALARAMQAMALQLVTKRTGGTIAAAPPAPGAPVAWQGVSEALQRLLTRSGRQSHR